MLMCFWGPLLRVHFRVPVSGFFRVKGVFYSLGFVGLVTLKACLSGLTRSFCSWICGGPENEGYVM